MTSINVEGVERADNNLLNKQINKAISSNKWTMKIKQDEGINIDKGEEVNGGYSRDFGKASFES